VDSRGEDTRIKQIAGKGGGKMGDMKGGMKGGKGWEMGWAPPPMMIQLPDGSVVKGKPVDKGKGKDKGKGPMMFGKGKGKMGEKGGPSLRDGTEKQNNSDKGPDPSKELYIGQVKSRRGPEVQQEWGENGFVMCDETFALYGRDVFMWKTYFCQCQAGDWVKFNVHVNDKGLPQVCWLEVVKDGVAGTKRPAEDDASGMKKPALWNPATGWA
jgi:hypothetical protein